MYFCLIHKHTYIFQNIQTMFTNYLFFLTIYNVVTPKPTIRGAGISGLQLWNGRNAQGHSLYTDGRETRLPYPMDMRSFQLVGRWKEWTVFENQDLSGESRCLLTDREGGENQLLYTNIPRPFQFSSIQEGCVSQSAFEYANGDGDGGGFRNIGSPLKQSKTTPTLTAFFIVICHCYSMANNLLYLN